ncbi:traffic jam [Anaeramoeba flamelloides]|uniref:Traffic jam n=1 Tax=Anaeramoeba flamelloides TaxID=1746091 RepID=A0ABQ8XT93_9EUKA|nr:traffic jam [Anaeramoeba flamelloides]
MNDLLADQLSFFSSSINDENLFQIPILDVDFEDSIFEDFQEFQEQQELSTNTKTTNEQQNKIQDQSFENLSPKSPEETELILSPNSFPLPFERDDLFSDLPIDLAEEDLIKRKRDHYQIGQNRILSTNNCDNKIVKTPKITTKTKTDSKPQRQTRTRTKAKTIQTNKKKKNNKSRINLTEKELGGDLTRLQLKLLTGEQKKKRKVLKNRVSAAKCYTKRKQKITRLDKVVFKLKKKKNSLTSKIFRAKNKRDMLLEKQSRLEMEIKKLLQPSQEFEERTNQVIGSIKDTFHTFGTIPAQGNEITESLNLPQTTIEDDEKWKKIKKKLVKNTNNRIGFAMMVVIIAITIVFGNEMLFNKSTTPAISLFSTQMESKRALQTFDFGLIGSKKDKYSSSQNIWIVEIDDTERLDHDKEEIETMPKGSQISSVYPESDQNDFQDPSKSFHN